MSIFYPLYPKFKEFKVEDFTQAGAVQNTWYTVIDKRNAEVSAIAVGITVANETVEIRLTIDGSAMTSAAGVALAFAGNAWSLVQSTVTLETGTPVLSYAAAAATATVTDNADGGPILWAKGQSVKVEIRKTSAGGASALRCVVMYSVF